jgi:DNA-binding NtrC family response regulator
MNRPRVLIVEDRPTVLAVLESVLASTYDVTTARDGKAALGMVGSCPIDVVLTDIRMPGASGFDVLRAVRSRSPRTQVVMMTAYAAVPDAVAAMKLGAFDYLAKPVDADELALVVARAAEGAEGSIQGKGRPTSIPGDDAAPSSLPDMAEGFRLTVEHARARASREYLVGLMDLFHGNVSHAAAWAGMTRESLHRVLKKYVVQSGEFRDETAGTPPRG